MMGSCLCGAVAYEVTPYDTKVGHCSCRTCRKARLADAWVILRAATLDEDPGARPLIHIWRSHEVPWCGFEGDIKDFAEGPPAR